jgi:UDP-2,3-diacylglucosamine hydrolase
MKKFGLIAGAGDLPLLVARGMVAKGYDLIVFALKDETDPKIEVVASKVHWFSPDEVMMFASTIASSKLDGVSVVGGPNKLKWTKNIGPVLGLIGGDLSDGMGDSRLLDFLATFLERNGIELIDPISFIDDKPPSSDYHAGPTLSNSLESDIQFGLSVAVEVGGLDIGQSVAIKNGTVVAVEALEGTDAMIRRAGEIAGKGVVIAKAARPGQDVRLDRPVVGVKTLEQMKDAGACALVVEADKVLIMESDRVGAMADKLGITIVARYI